MDTIIVVGGGEDIFLWADGTYCTREEYWRGEYAYMSDDFVVLHTDSQEHADFLAAQDVDFNEVKDRVHRRPIPLNNKW